MDAMLTTAPPPPASRIAATARFNAKAYLRRQLGGGSRHRITLHVDNEG